MTAVYDQAPKAQVDPQDHEPVQTPLDKQPQSHDQADTRSGFLKNRWVQGLTVGAGALLVVGIAKGTILGGDGGEIPQPHNTSGQPSASADLVPGAHLERPSDLTVDNASPEQFFSDEYFTDSERVTWADNQLQAPSTDPEYPNMTVEQAAYQRIKGNLKDTSGVILGDLTRPSLESTPGEADIQTYTATAAAIFEPNFQKANKMLAAAFDSKSEFYSNLIDGMATFRASNPSEQQFRSQTIAYWYTPWNPSSANLVPQATQISDSNNKPLENIFPAEGIPTRIAMQHVSQDSARVNNSDYEMVSTFVDGKRWVEAQKITPNDLSVWIQPDRLINIG